MTDWREKEWQMFVKEASTCCFLLHLPASSRIPVPHLDTVITCIVPAQEQRQLFPKHIQLKYHEWVNEVSMNLMVSVSIGGIKCD